MNLHKVGKIAFALTAVLSITLVSLFAVLCVHAFYTDGERYIVEHTKEIFSYIVPISLIAIVFGILGTVLYCLAKRKNLLSINSRKRLSLYESIYRVSSFSDGASENVQKIIRHRNISDFVACQVLSFSLVAIIDYFVFFFDFDFTDAKNAVEEALIFVLPVAFIGVATYVLGLFYSEKKSADALKLIEGDLSKKSKAKSKASSDELISFNGEVFSRFKKRLNTIRIAKAAMIGACAGLVSGGAWLVLTKLAVLAFDPLSSIFIGVGAALMCGGLAFLFGGRSDKSLAEELDAEFDLNARAQTMIAYCCESGEMAELQRQDAKRALAEIPVKSYKFKGLWIYIVALLLSAAVLVGGIIVKDMRGYIPPEEVIPFELTELQEIGVLQLIKTAESSGMEKEFSSSIADELRDLLATLRNTHTQNDMRAALAKSMAIIVDITYESSTATEVLNALWDSGNIYFRHLAKVLDTSSQSSADWGEFAEKLTDYTDVLLGEDDEENTESGKETLKKALDGMTDRVDMVLGLAGVPDDDEICLAINRLFFDESYGLSLILQGIDSLSDEEARVALEESFSDLSDELFEAISLNKTNAVTGEYAMTRLSGLFLVPVPEFERPDFVRKNESVGGDHDGEIDNDPENGGTQGGIGSGATYSGDDEVLDPLTGKIVKYGELIDRYNAIMYERLEGDFYTEEQKEAIRKYFELLYSGLEKKEGK